MKEILTVEALVEGKQYLAHGVSHGDGHLSDKEIPCFRRVFFTTTVEGVEYFKVAEKEDSTRGWFEVKRLWSLPDIYNGEK